MASYRVRQEFRQAWPLLMPAVPYFETINLQIPDAEIAARPDLWGTFVFQGELAQALTMGAAPWMLEQGSAGVMLLSRSGLGDQALAEAAETATKVWRGWITQDGAVWVETIDAPQHDSETITGNWLIASVSLGYRFQYRGM